MKIKSAIILSILTIIIQIPATSTAAWVDDWLQQRTTTAPNHLKGQQRGYYTAGGFSARWPSTDSYPVTVTPPRLKGGCGGIDMFLGGMSFMNADYLEDKLQRLLANGASVAFDLGLQVLCQQCSTVIKNFEALSDKLNGMQLDECSAAKTMVGIVADKNGFHSSEEMQKKLDTAIKQNKLVQGTSEMWHMISKDVQAQNNEPQSGDVSAITSGCNADITSIFLATGSMLENVGSKMGTPSNYIDLIRGLVGDVRLEGAANAYKVSYEPPCPQNNPDDINSLVTGDLYARDVGGTCSQISDANRDLRQFVLQKLTTIADKIKNKGGALSPDEEDFISKSPLSPLPILKTAVGTEMEATMIDSLAELSARAYAVQLISDLYQRADNLAWKAREILEKEGEPAAGQPNENCQAAVFAEHADNNISIMINRVKRLKKAAKTSYIAAAQGMNEIMIFLEHQKRIEQQMRNELASRYGRVIADKTL